MLAYGVDELGRSPFPVWTAPCGPPAFEVLLRSDFDVLIADCGSDAQEIRRFVGEVRRIWPWLGLVVIDGEDADGTAVGKELGAECTLQKPAPFEALHEKVEAAFEKCKTRRPERSADAAQGITAFARSLAPVMEQAVGESSLLGALRALGRGLFDLMSFDVIGTLGLGDTHIMNLAARLPVHMDLLAGIEQEMLARFRALAGRSLDRESFRLEREHVVCDPAGPHELARSLSLPVVCGGEIVGVITVGDLTTAEPYSYEDVSLLAITAGHMVSIFSALRGMRSLATRDALTDALNRMGLEDALERTWQMSRRYGFPMGVVVADLDHFKTLNDSYGHSVGDDVIREFSGVMLEVSRASDVIARYGGDEFVAILPQAEEEATRAFSERLLTATRERVFCRDSHRLKMTVSIGLSTTQSPMPPATGDELLNQADRALYTSKREGRNRLCVWPENTAMLAQAAPRAPSENGAAPIIELTTHLGRIMVVDDEEMVRSTIQTILKREGYDVDGTHSAESALQMMKEAQKGAYGLVLTDLNMPGKSGIELLQDIAEIDDEVVRIVITGFATVDNAVSSLREGAYDFIQKPVRATQMLAIARRALEYRRLKIENARYHAHLEDLVRERSAQLASSLDEIEKSHEFTLEAMVAMLDARENQTAEHSLRVRELAIGLGEKMGFEEEELRTLAQAALLHDIGKISVSDAILLKPGPLVPEEWEAIKKHPETGYRIVRSSSYLRDAAEIVWSHHERHDGKGYPRGLAGNEICKGARVFKVIDAYEAMRSERVYRGPMRAEEAADAIKAGRATEFDPEAVDAFMKYQPELERIFNMGA